MRRIIEILWVEKTKTYERTHAKLDDGSIVVGFGTDFKIGDLVMSFYHEKYDQHKMSKPKVS